MPPLNSSPYKPKPKILEPEALNLQPQILNLKPYTHPKPQTALHIADNPQIAAELRGVPAAAFGGTPGGAGAAHSPCKARFEAQGLGFRVY